MGAFTIVAVVGVVLLVAALVAGEFADGLLEPVNGLLGADVLSTGAVAGFLGAFGFTGAVLEGQIGGGLAALAGVGAGGAVGYAAAYLTTWLARGATDVTPSDASLAGARGTVVTPIPSQGYGEVTVVVAGHRLKLNARSYEPLPVGTGITVVAVLSPTAVSVARVE
jgi:hypothetical protein